MPKIAKRELGSAAADADKDHPLAPKGSTLDVDRTWHRETCGGCDYEAVVEVPEEIEVAPVTTGAPPELGIHPVARAAVLWDCPNGHRNAVEVRGVDASPVTAADTDARSVTAGDSGRGQNN